MKVLDIFTMSSSLSAMTRYSQTYMHKKESVLEHIGFVTLFCKFVGEQVNDRYTETGKGVGVDIGLLLSKAIVHDLDEIITGDIPRPTKYFSEEAHLVFETIEKAGMEKLVEDCNLSPEIYSNWSHAKDGAEGKIVAIADMAAVVYKIWEEIILMHNHTFIGHAVKVNEYIGVLLHQETDTLLRNILIELRSIAEEAIVLDKSIYKTMRRF